MVGSVEIVKLLLDSGYPVDNLSNGCEVPLQAAAAHGHEDVVRVLLEHGACVHHRGGLHVSALNAAIYSKSEGIQIMLLEHGHIPEDNIEIGSDGEVLFT